MFDGRFVGISVGSIVCATEGGLVGFSVFVRVLDGESVGMYVGGFVEIDVGSSVSVIVG